MNFFFILALITALATLATLFVGVTGMARQGDFNKKYGNKLMRLRVTLQFLTIIFLLLAVAGD